MTRDCNTSCGADIGVADEASSGAVACSRRKTRLGSSFRKDILDTAAYWAMPRTERWDWLDAHKEELGR